MAGPEAGDCVASVIGKQKLGEAVTTDCNKPHLWQIVAITDYEATTFNEEKITAAVDEFCDENSPSIDTELVGANADQMRYIAISPDKVAFAMGDKKLVCIVGSDEYEVSQSLMDN